MIGTRIALTAAASLLAAAAAIAQQPAPGAAENGPEMVAIRAASARYVDVALAQADGYIPDPTGACVTAAMTGHPSTDGEMGLHWFRPDLLGITRTQPRVDGNDATIDWEHPDVLVYEPHADGTLKLVAAEFLVFQAAWDAAHPEGPPTIGDVPFTLMADDPATEIDEAHQFEPHYELHVWTERPNPRGMFAEFNPDVHCPAPAVEQAAAPQGR